MQETHFPNEFHCPCVAPLDASGVQVAQFEFLEGGNDCKLIAAKHYAKIVVGRVVEEPVGHGVERREVFGRVGAVGGVVLRIDPVR